MKERLTAITVKPKNIPKKDCCREGQVAGIKPVLVMKGLARVLLRYRRKRNYFTVHGWAIHYFMASFYTRQPGFCYGNILETLRDSVLWAVCITKMPAAFTKIFPLNLILPEEKLAVSISFPWQNKERKCQKCYCHRWKISSILYEHPNLMQWSH